MNLYCRRHHLFLPMISSKPYLVILRLQFSKTGMEHFLTSFFGCRVLIDNDSCGHATVIEVSVALFSLRYNSGLNRFSLDRGINGVFFMGRFIVPIGMEFSFKLFKFLQTSTS